MNNNNPYKSPQAAVKAEPQFDPNRLPLVFSVPSSGVGGAGFWVGVLAMALVSFALPFASLLRFSNTNWLSLIAPAPPLFTIGLCLWALLCRIEISKTGIRIHRTKRQISWSEIHEWNTSTDSTNVLSLKNGRKLKIIGPATSVARNKVIGDALAYFISRGKPDNGG